MSNRSGGGIERIVEADISRGVYSGAVTRVAQIGSRTIATAFSGIAAGQDIWPGTATEITLASAGESWEIVCTNANDTLGGTGAETVSFTPLDSAYNPLPPVTVTLNGGTTAVPNGAVNLRINAAACGAVNPSAGRRRNLGDIRIQVAGGGGAANTIRGIIPAYVGNLRQACYTVAAGFTLEIPSLELQLLSSGGGTPRGADGLLLFRASNGNVTAPRPIGTTDGQPYALEARTMIRVNEKFDFIGQCIYTSNNNIQVGFSWEGWLYRN